MQAVENSIPVKASDLSFFILLSFLLAQAVLQPFKPLETRVQQKCFTTICLNWGYTVGTSINHHVASASHNNQQALLVFSHLHLLWLIVFYFSPHTYQYSLERKHWSCADGKQINIYFSL